MRRLQLPPAGPLVFDPQSARPGPRLSRARAQAEPGLGPEQKDLCRQTGLGRMAMPRQHPEPVWTLSSAAVAPNPFCEPHLGADPQAG